jgi:transposase-like protein
MSLFEFQQQFPDEASCVAFLESQRWGENSKNRFCPHCGSLRSYKFQNGNLYKCADCRKQFTVTVGTIFEGSHIPLLKWFYAARYNMNFKKGVSSVQLAKELKITQKSCWFMLQRIRYGFENSGNKDLLGNIVEIDESYIGGRESNKHYNKRVKGAQGRGSQYSKAPVVGILERKGNLRLMATSDTSATTVHQLIQSHVAKGATVMTDEYRPYRTLHKLGYIGMRVNHGEHEYVRGEAHINSLEGTWAHLKLSIQAIYVGVSKKHLQKYCAEFCYRFNRRGMDDSAKFNDWFSHCNGRLLYKNLIAGTKRPKQMLNPSQGTLLLALASGFAAQPSNSLPSDGEAPF